MAFHCESDRVRIKYLEDRHVPGYMCVKSHNYLKA